ncbi:hypothetical protein [Streptomyces sp. URMC 123]|uniref:hypothetical protein n=1 Tax=Streptomyces sp. URMC 123 TaxID=3423403 RepID=UPI003F1CE02E
MSAPASVPAERAAADLRLLRAAVFAAVCAVLSAAGHVLASCATVPLWTLVAGFLAVLAAAAPLAGRERSLPGIAAGLAVAQLGLHALFALGQHGLALGQHGASAASAGSGPAAGGAAPGAGGASDGTLIALAARLVCDTGPARMTAAEAQRIVTAAGIDPTGHPAHAGGAAMAAEVPGPSPSLLAGLLPSLPMLLAHLLAAVVLGLLLRRGEAALFRLVRLSAGSARVVAHEALAGSLRAALALACALCAGLVGAPNAGPRAPRAQGRDKAGPQVLALAHSVIRRGPPDLALAA